MRDQANWAMSILGRGLVATAAGLVVVVVVPFLVYIGSVMYEQTFR